MKIKRWLKFSVKTLVSILVLAWLFKDLEFDKVTEYVKLMPAWAWVTGFFMYFLAQFFSSIRWQLIAKYLKLNGSFQFYIGLYFLGMFYNLFLPTGMGGDVVKSYHLGKRHEKHLSAAYSVLFDRIFGLLALMLICACALWFVDWADPASNKLISVVIIFGVACLPFSVSIIKLMQRLIPKLHHWLEPVNLLFQNSRLMMIFTLSLLIQLIGIILVIGLGTILNINLDWSFYIVSWTIITLATLLPISINGIGVRESSFVYLFKMQGIPEEQAIALSFLTFIIPLLVSLTGLIPFTSATFSKPTHVKTY